MDILHFYSIPLHTHNISPIYTHTLNTPSSHTLSTNMKTQSNNPLLLIKLLTLHSLLVLSASQDFDFFYFVQQVFISFLINTIVFIRSDQELAT
ncbi:putative ribonuclease T(2) [Helianthus annuus]|nr:putative ribonuclease T(2) [Helianthus annuus]